MSPSTPKIDIQTLGDTPLVSLPYSKRQFIIVVDDSVMEAKSKEELASLQTGAADAPASQEFQQAKTKAEEYVRDPEKTESLLEKAAEKAKGVGGEPLRTCPLLTSDFPRGKTEQNSEVIFGRLLSQVSHNLAAFLRLVRAYIRGEYTHISRESIILVIAAIIYFVLLIDLIPDFIPVAGLVDDVAVIMFGTYAIREELDKFLQWEARQSDKKATGASTYGMEPDGVVRILAVTCSQAAHLKFPPGHPRKEVLYVGHPVIATVYYNMAHFHLRTFEHKFSEVVRLLMSLGATKIEVEHVKGWSNEFSAKLGLSLGDIAQTGIEAARARESRAQILYRATYENPNPPALPEDLVWYSHEPTWQQIVDGRLNHGLRSFSLTLQYEEDFGVNADLKATVLQYGLDLGGKFEDYHSTLWRIVGEF